MPESTQHKLDRVRRPRVQITYDVETLGSIVKTELPFVVGIMADLSGYDKKLNRTPPADRPPLKERKFVEIDRDNFDQIMEKLTPQVKVNGDDLSFKTLEDFNPINVLRNVPELRKKFESRTRLSNLLAKLDGNPTLQKSLVDAIRNLSTVKEHRDALQTYIRVNLKEQDGDGAAAPPFDAEATVNLIPAARRKDVRSYIVERYPDTVTPDVAAIAAAVEAADDQPKKLKAHILEQYPYAVTDDAAKLATALTDAQKTDLQTHIATAFPTTANSAASADMATTVAALDDAQRKELKAHILKTYPDAVTDTNADLAGRLGDEDKDELKAHILENFDVAAGTIKPVREGIGSKVTLPILMNSLKAHEKRELSDYIKKTYVVTTDNPEGDQS